MNFPTLEERIQRLEALKAIDDLIADLGRAFDAGPSAQALSELFATDAVFVIDSYATFQGRSAIAEGVAGNAEQGFRWTLHFLVSPKVDLDQDMTSAAIEFYLWEVATGASGRAYWIGGRYTAQAALRGGTWQFQRLELTADLISHYPDGWAAKPATLADV